MIATIDLADLGSVATLRTLVHRPPREVSGLRWAQTAVLAPLATRRPPSSRRAGLIAFWDDAAAAEQFRRDHLLGRRFVGGFHATLRPLRAFGSWPGLPADLPSSRSVEYDGPVVVITLGRLRSSQVIRFLRTSRPAERSAVQADGLLWGTAAARPPFVATISIWDDSRAAVAYAYGTRLPAHGNAITAQRRKDFHLRSAFVRFEPLSVAGTLDDTNPLTTATLTSLIPMLTGGTPTP